MQASILAISTAVPSYVITQEKIADKIIDMLSLDAEKATSIKQLYQNSAIRTRYSVISDFTKDRKDWHFFGSEFPKKVPGTLHRNNFYKIEAPKLAYKACLKALNSWGGDPATISHVISVSCTGMVAPGIEFDIVKLLKLKASTERLAINFMGCFGAFKGLSVAQSFAKENPKNRILVVCTELCSLHFQAEQTPDNILANSLFSDGAAAVIVGADPQSEETVLWEINNKCSLALDNTYDKMSWEASDQGFIMKLSQRIPSLLKKHIATFIQCLVIDNFSFENCDWAIHPGGKSIIQSIEKALNLNSNQTQASWETLANYGNMSSATFLFVLNSLLQQKNQKKWTVGIGFGPGLCMEGILLNRAL
jgi:predicted naringenin-chalcone synthase